MIYKNRIASYFCTHIALSDSPFLPNLTRQVTLTAIPDPTAVEGMLTFGSLFAGIGGLDLGLERAGMKCLWQVEIDNYATKVLEKHWPDVQRFRDIRDCGKHNLPAVDLICGGFPCQDVSLAGKRAGLEGKRTTLWSEFARIIGEIRPRWVLAENVPGLLSSDSGRFFGNVLRDLAACGYDAEWDCIPAAAVGAPHRRDRVFIVAYPPGMGCPYADTYLNAESCGKAPQANEGFGMLDAAASFIHRQVFANEIRPFTTSWTTEPNVGRVANGVPARVDRLRCLGNAVVPQVAEFIGRMILLSDGGDNERTSHGDHLEVRAVSRDELYQGSRLG